MRIVEFIVDRPHEVQDLRSKGFPHISTVLWKFFVEARQGMSEIHSGSLFLWQIVFSSALMLFFLNKAKSKLSC